MFKKKATTALLALLIAAACTGTPPPAPDLTPPAAASSDTPAAGYPVAAETEPAYPLPDFPTEDPAYPLPGTGEGEEPASGGYPAPEDGDCVPEEATPQHHEVLTSDGVTLSGTYYPSAGCGAPLVLLYHEFGSEKNSWSDLALWLQNRTGATAAAGVLASVSGQYAWFPALPDDLSFAVFAIDFRGHGESVLTEGSPAVSGFLVDAKAAFDYAKTLPNVDPARVITIGASIGADASVDVCLVLEGFAIAAEQASQGCIGAVALSPGSFLETLYVEVVTRLGEPPFDVNILCVAAEHDANAPDLCSAEVPGRHTGVVYAGRSEHGQALIAEGFDPDIGQVIFDFLMETLGIEG